MSRHFIPVLIACALLSCLEQVEVVVDLPEEVAWITLVSSDGEGNMEGSGLFRAKDGAAVAARTTRDQALILGYTEQQIRLLTDDVTRLPQDPLTSPEKCDPTLPPPYWAAALDSEQRPVKTATTTAPALTANWLKTSCPPFEGTTLIDVRCGVCGAVVRRSDEGCGVVLEMCDSNLLVFGHVHPDGHLCLPHGEASSLCESAAAPPGAWGAVNCDDCQYDIYQRDRTISPPWEADVLTLPEPAVHVVVSHPILVRYLWAYPDLIVHGDQLVVAAQTEDLGACDVNSRLSQLLFFDLETLEPTGSSSAPPCLMRIANDPHRGGYQMLSRTSDGYRVVYPNGTSTTSAFELENEADGWLPVELIPDGRRTFVLVVERGISPDPARVDMIEDGQIEQYHSVLGGIALGRAGDNRLVLSTRHQSQVTWLDTEEGFRVLNQSFTTFMNSDYIVDLHVAGEKLVGVTMDHAGMNVMNPYDGKFVFAALYDRHVQSDAVVDKLNPIVAAPWPPDPDRLLVGVVSRDAVSQDFLQAYLTFYHVPSSRFLPGVWPLPAEGVPTRIVRDEQNRLYVLMPRSWKVVRITPER